MKILLVILGFVLSIALGQESFPSLEMEDDEFEGLSYAGSDDVPNGEPMFESSEDYFDIEPEFTDDGISKRSIEDHEALVRVRRGGHGHGIVGPVHTHVRTDHHGNFQWGVRHRAGKHYSGHHG